ncbi:MAG TPA: adenylyl-sulfate kinase [Saprospiraceae bacterium]|nr:adenylyl-sulfate kinase [Saprospiraceae bacterium]
MKDNSNIYPTFENLVQRVDRELFLNQKSKVLWFTGLSGSGKSTIAQGVEEMLFQNSFFAQVLDGDNVRTGINKDLGFSPEERTENIRRIAEVAKLYLNSGVITLCSFVSPTIAIRQQAKGIIGAKDFIEIFVNTPLGLCEKRDIKGLYKKARKGEIKGFTGIDSPYEKPENPMIEIFTEKQTIKESIQLVYNRILPIIKI